MLNKNSKDRTSTASATVAIDPCSSLMEDERKKDKNVEDDALDVAKEIID